MRCICEAGERCFHDGFLFAVSERSNGSVAAAVLEQTGWLCFVTFSGFTSWTTLVGPRARARGRGRRVPGALLIDRITREVHAVTLVCDGWTDPGWQFVFHGKNVRIDYEEVHRAAPPGGLRPEVSCSAASPMCGQSSASRAT